MNLQLDKILFTDTITAASIELSIPVDFVEKDYWITLVLSRLANSKYFSEAVFKGGTSTIKRIQSAGTIFGRCGYCHYKRQCKNR